MEQSIQSYLIKFKDSESSTSVIFGAIVVIVAGLLIFNFVSSNRMPQVSPTGEATESAQIVANENGYVAPSTLPTKHTVKAGESLWKIAELYYGSGYNFVDVLKVNNITEQSGINSGQELLIPQVKAMALTVTSPQAQKISGDSYQTKSGDSLWEIAVRAYGDGYKWTSILQANSDVIKDPSKIDVGMTLKLVR